ncbi:DEAD/DEAH box helicase family protein [Muricauda oceani]|uniref:Type I restriction endonuclease subunit R n=1 Tax=Flagellimonas oceani TaxID=2698672 RepID=A0A6G7IZK5_9FLAO|nr:type I restriction endonuclease [Allomuricauda oceani]MBW8245174.1 DEAD/DEAH box helicase family protein [Allomuricauda oceani]QII43819.1 type I restriction endonuclease subunit R [Allomuricauda oceani]
MTWVPTEKRFEEFIEDYLTSLEDDGLKYESKTHRSTDTWYDREKCIIGGEYIQFVKDSQPDVYKTLQKKYGGNTDSKILSRLNKEIGNKGLIHVLRKGFNEIQGGNIKTVYFQPSSSLNKKYREDKYLKNRFLFVRQLHYSPHTEKSIDVVLFINGIPILTIELKNQLTGQTVQDSNYQYKFDRDPKGEPLLQFQRCVCHFSMDNDRVMMTTKLSGEDTFFLPFNKGLENPINPNGYRVSYMWEEILTPTSLLDILENFVLFTQESDLIWSDEKKKVIEKKKSVLIFPRYHQLDVIRELQKQVVLDNVGTNYLVQHTTGSGKSYSIGWLSFMLINLFKNDGQDRMFDSIIIITDRKVLDRQLQDTVKSLEQVQGVVQQIDKDSKQLEKSLGSGKNIIITTIQKFSVVVNRIKELKGMKFGVIVDEVHSSQGGKGTKNLNKTLSVNLNQDEPDVDDDRVNEEVGKIQMEMKSRQKQNHISFFGFTGTPKPQTIEIFGTPQPDGSKIPFHTYTMRQSIGEGFTMDVLKSFTPVKRWFKLRGKGEDVELPESRGKKELIKWVDSNEETIRRKVSIILDNLLSTTVKSIEGRGKGMVVVRSIDDTVKYFVEMNKQLKERGLYNRIKPLVSFTGDVQLEGSKVTEGDLNRENGFDGKDIPKGFKNPVYRVLIVCNKFQTGFDEPLLHSMFIDKPLNGVQCVQTLSRLNRKTRGKKSTFVLDFVNSIDTIQDSFQNFYQTTILSEETDPNLVYDLLDEIRNYGLFTKQEVDDWCSIFYQDKRRDDGQLQPTLNTVIERWRELSDEDRDESRSKVSNYCKLYGYISMIHQFDNIELEKHYVFFEYLRKKFPVDSLERIDVSNLVDLESLTLDIKGKTDISLNPEDNVFDPNKYGTGRGKDEEEFDLLSQIIEDINNIYGNVPEGTEESSKKLIQNMVSDTEFEYVVNSNNTDSNKRDKLRKIYDEKNIGTLDISTKLFEYFDKKENKERLIQLFISKPELLNQLRG